MPKYQDNQYRSDTSSNSSHSFYQSYVNQIALNSRERERRRHRGMVAYVTVVTILLLVCIALLAAMFIWHLQMHDTHSTQNNTLTGQPTGGQIKPQMTTSAVAEKVTPSVVLISAISGSSGSNGTGFFLTKDGYIVTNYHVVDGADEIHVTLHDGQELAATLVGYRAEDDLAVIKVDGENYPKVSIGNSDALVVGEVAIAIGNPGGAEGGWTTTQGIISALNRVLSVEESAYFSEMKMLQTDAQVNPGNSGGPLCNASGEVIGIVTRKISGYEGIGYAIPINEAMATINAIIDGKLDGFVSQVSKSRPKIGISVVSIVKGEKFTYEGVSYVAPVDGVFIASVVAGGPAVGALEGGDIIFAINGKSVTSIEELQNVLYQCYIGQKVTFDLYRKNQKMTVEITLGVS